MVSSSWECAHPDHWRKVIAHNDDIDMQYGPLRLTPPQPLVEETNYVLVDTDRTSLNNKDEISHTSSPNKSRGGVEKVNTERDNAGQVEAKTKEEKGDTESNRNKNAVQIITKTGSTDKAEIDVKVDMELPTRNQLSTNKPISYPVVSLSASDIVSDSTHLEVECMEIYSSAASVEVKCDTGYIGTYRSEEGMDQMFGITVALKKPMTLSQIKLKFFSLAAKNELIVYFIRVDGKVVPPPVPAANVPSSSGMMPMHLMSLLAGLSAPKAAEAPKLAGTKSTANAQVNQAAKETQAYATAIDNNSTPAGNTTVHNNTTTEDTATRQGTSALRHEPEANNIPTVSIDEKTQAKGSSNTTAALAIAPTTQPPGKAMTSSHTTEGSSDVRNDTIHTEASSQHSVHNTFTAPEDLSTPIDSRDSPAMNAGQTAAPGCDQAITDGVQAVSGSTSAVHSLTAAVNTGTSAVNTGTMAVNHLSTAVQRLQAAVETGTRAMRVSMNVVEQGTVGGDETEINTDADKVNMTETIAGSGCAKERTCTCSREGISGSDVERMLEAYEERMKQHIDAQMQGLRDGLKADLIQFMSGV